MKVGMNLLLWTAAASEEHLPLLGAIRDWGYDSVELPMFAAGASPWKRLARALDDLGLHRTAVTVMPPEANPISEEPAVRRAGVEHLKRCVDACADLGAGVLCGPLTSPCGALVGRGRTEDEWRWGAEAVREAACHAASAGVTLAVEPLNRFETYFLTCQADAARFVREVGAANVGLLYDTFHANIEEKDPVAAVQAVGPWIAHFHVSENDRGTPGEGHVPWEATLAALKRTGYDGALTVEAFGRAMPEVAAATCIWRETFASEENLARDACAFIRRVWTGV